MQGVLNQSQPGFYKVLGGSLLFHIIVISMGLVLFKAEPKRIFFSPVYSVNLVDPAALKPVKKKVRKKKAIKKAAPKKVRVKKSVKAKPAPQKTRTKPAPKKKAVAVKKAAPPKPAPVAKTVEPKKAERVSVASAISRISERVKEEDKKQSETLLASRIKELEDKKKAEEVRSKVEALREDIEVKSELEALRARLTAQEAVTPEAEKQTPEPAAEVEVEAPLPALGEIKPVITARTPERISRELFELKFKDYYNAVGSKIQSLWIYPGKAVKDHEVLVSIRIARSGELISSWVEKKSRNKVFDESALKAVEKAAPYPPLPEDYDGDYLEIGFRFIL